MKQYKLPVGHSTIPRWDRFQTDAIRSLSLAETNGLPLRIDGLEDEIQFPFGMAYVQGRTGVLGGGNSNIFWNFHPETWGRFPFWLLFFKGVETTNQASFREGILFLKHFWCNKSVLQPTQLKRSSRFGRNKLTQPGFVGWGLVTCPSHTLPKINTALENRPWMAGPEKERITFQPPTFRCELLVSGRQSFGGRNCNTGRFI